MRLKIAKAFVVLLSAMMALGTGITARADTGESYKTQAMEDLDTGKSSSLTINFHTSKASGKKPVSGAEFSVYQVAAVSVSKLGDGNTTYTLAENFAGTAVDAKEVSFPGMDAEASNEAAEAFAKVVAEKSLRTDFTATTDDKGVARFESLPNGAYLVCETAATGMAGNYKPLSPYLVLVPGIIPSKDSSEFNSWEYNVTSEPKPQIDPKSGAVVDIPVTKIVTGSQAPADAAFRFELKAADAASPMPSDSKDGVKELTVSGAGKFSFGNIAYGAIGTYRYTCREINTGIKNFTYDDTVYDITVDVTGEDADSLKADVTVKRGNEGVDGIVFTNKYTPEETGKTEEGGHHEDKAPSPVYPGVAELLVNKTVSGDKPQKDAEFHFVLQADAAGNYMPNGSTNGAKEIAIVGAGSGNFGVVGFYKAGVYTYTVRELNTGEPNYKFDESVFKVTVTVTDISAAKDGSKLSAQTVYTKNGQKVSGISFDNKYTKEKEKISVIDRVHTGDSSRMMLYGSISLAAAAAIAVYIAIRKRNKDK